MQGQGVGERPKSSLSMMRNHPVMPKPEKSGSSKQILFRENTGNNKRTESSIFGTGKEMGGGRGGR